MSGPLICNVCKSGRLACTECGAHAFVAAGERICGMVSTSGPFYEPLACGFPAGHLLDHSWATLPTFDGMGHLAGIVNSTGVNEMADFGERMTGFPAFQPENPSPMPPCGHCGGTASRQPYIDRPLLCPRCHEPACWTCSKRGLMAYHEADR